MEVGDVWAHCPWQCGGGQSERKSLRCCENEMSVDESESGKSLHDLSFFLFEFDSALEADSK